MNSVRITEIGVSVEHHNVRELAYLQRANLILQPQLPSSIRGVRSNCLINTESLADSGLNGHFRVTCLLPSDCHLNIEHGVQSVFADPADRVVAAQGDLAAVPQNRGQRIHLVEPPYSKIPERQMYPLASILRHGGKVTLGSDYPVSWIGKDALNPMFNIEMAVTRQQAGNPEVPVQARVSERLSVDQAIRAHTSDAAWQLRLEDEIGTLEVGKLADIVVLERDPYASDPYQIHTIKIDHTFSDGRLVFTRATAQ